MSDVSINVGTVGRLKRLEKELHGKEETLLSLAPQSSSWQTGRKASDRKSLLVDWHTGGCDVHILLTCGFGCVVVVAAFVVFMRLR